MADHFIILQSQVQDSGQCHNLIAKQKPHYEYVFIHD